MTTRWLALALTVALAAPTAAHAAFEVKLDDGSSLELGLRLQSQFISTQTDRDGDGHYESQNDFRVRRARVKVRASYGRWATAYVQTALEEQGGTSPGSRVLDAYVLLKPHEAAWFYLGENMAPALRQNLTSAGASMVLDRPGLAWKALTWGGRAKYAFAGTTFRDSSAELNTQARTPVRDMGATLFGNVDVAPVLHLKYYLGLYDGVQAARSDSLRMTVRAQVNLFEPETGYYNDGTYLGEKRTVAIGGSYDRQEKVALDQATGRKADYQLFSVDAFAETPLPIGVITAEAGYVSLDLGGGGALVTAGGTALGDAARAQGNGFFAQVGYLLREVQPWVNYERWTSDATDDRGSYRAYRAGLNYFLKGHGAKLVAAFERFEPAVKLSSSQSAIDTFVVGAYLDY